MSSLQTGFLNASVDEREELVLFSGVPDAVTTISTSVSGCAVYRLLVILFDRRSATLLMAGLDQTKGMPASILLLKPELYCIGESNRTWLGWLW
jgi:hypothetical protein